MTTAWVEQDWQKRVYEWETFIKISTDQSQAQGKFFRIKNFEKETSASVSK